MSRTVPFRIRVLTPIAVAVGILGLFWVMVGLWGCLLLLHAREH